MRAFIIAATSLFVVVACGNGTNSAQPTTPTATAAYATYPPPGYPPGTAPPPGYPPAGFATAAPYAAPQPYPAPAPASPAPYPTPPAAPATGTMSVPGLLALPCQSDATCGLHHCNTQYSKCAFPCQTSADCLSPNQCLMGVCVPGSGS